MKLVGAMSSALIRGTLLAAASAALAAPVVSIETSESCGECHRTIYQTWKTSAHAQALEDDIFLQAYRETEARSGGAASRVCLHCHAPLVDVNGDVELKQRLTWEGVSCEVCHALVSVNLSGMGPRQVLDLGSAKRGPIRDAPDTAHGVAFSELHTTSLACAWCHEYVNPEGTPIMTTFSEWKSSSMASEGRTCQACHMSQADSGVIEPRAERVAGARINLHHVPGGHSLDQLHKALALSIRHARVPEGLELDLLIRNRGAGHAVPTGMPGRRVILELTVRTSDGQKFAERKVYAKSFVDSAKNVITRDGDYFVPGVALHADTRLGPDEERQEVFRFPVPDRATAYVTVKMHYEHSPTGTDAGRTWLTFLAERRTVTPDTSAEP